MTVTVPTKKDMPKTDDNANVTEGDEFKVSIHLFVLRYSYKIMPDTLIKIQHCGKSEMCLR